MTSCGWGSAPGRRRPAEGGDADDADELLGSVDFTIGLMIDGLVTPQLRLCESAHIRSAHTLKAPPCLLPAEQSMVVFKDQNALGGEACPTS
jgi:hypothetical protein